VIASQGPNVLFCNPNRTKCVLLVSVMCSARGRICGLDRECILPVLDGPTCDVRADTEVGWRDHQRGAHAAAVRLGALDRLSERVRRDAMRNVPPIVSLRLHVDGRATWIAPTEMRILCMTVK
jgi:hypothetical protein